MRPLVLAVMPTRNQSQYITQAIHTVIEASGVDRLVIVDDSSTDDTGEVIDDWECDDIDSLRLGSQVGTARAINAGVETLVMSPSIWWTWVSSDNWYEAGWAARLLEEVDENTGAVYSAFWFIAQKTEKHFTQHRPDQLINQLACYYGPCFLIRSDVWAAVGDHRGAISHDYDHWLRVEEECWDMGLKIVGIDEPLCHYRAHDQRRTVTERDSFDAHRWQKEALRRRQRARDLLAMWNGS